MQQQLSVICVQGYVASRVSTNIDIIAKQKYRKKTLQEKLVETYCQRQRFLNMSISGQYVSTLDVYGIIQLIQTP